MVANGCLIEAKSISSCQKETAQTSVFMLYLPKTFNLNQERQTVTTHNSNRHFRVPSCTLAWENLCRNNCIHQPSRERLSEANW